MERNSRWIAVGRCCRARFSLADPSCGAADRALSICERTVPRGYNRARTCSGKSLVKKITAFALVAFALRACSSPEKQAQRAHQEILHSEPNLAAAQRAAVIDCTPANCDAAW